MDIFRREDVHQLREHILKESEHSILTGAKDLIRDAPSGPDLVRATGAPKLRIAGQATHHVARKVNLRDHHNAQLAGVGDNVLHLLLSVVATVADAVITAPILLDDSTVSERSYLGELRVLLDFNPPTLVISQMPMEAVELVKRHDVQILLDFLDGEEMPRAVKVHASVAEARLVLDLHAREEELLRRVRLITKNIDARELLQCLDRIEESIVRRSADDAVNLADGDGIFLLRETRVIKEYEALHLVVVLVKSHRSGVGAYSSADECDLVGEFLDDLLTLGINGLIAVEIGAGTLERTFPNLDALRIRDDIDRCFGFLRLH